MARRSRAQQGWPPLAHDFHFGTRDTAWAALGEADAVILVHRLDHVVDELLDDGVAEVRLLELPCAPAQNRVPHARDFEDRH